MPTKEKRPRLTKHQTRVLVALHALYKAHNCEWWSRDAIGSIVDAGGFHQTIQLRTMSILKEAGLVQTQRSSWTEEMRMMVRCSCGCCDWGLTAAGLEFAESFRVVIDKDSKKQINQLAYQTRHDHRDEDDRPWLNGGDDDDDDDGDNNSPAPKPRPQEPCLA